MNQEQSVERQLTELGLTLNNVKNEIKDLTAQINHTSDSEERTELEAKVLRLKGREDGVLQEMKNLQARRHKKESV
jgi:septal ring factor EnvC (AmiA/AmiB activator)